MATTGSTPRTGSTLPTPLSRVRDFLQQWDRGDVIADADGQQLRYSDLAHLADYLSGGGRRP